jgi:chemotaxis protein methyltransferase CheR
LSDADYAFLQAFLLQQTGMVLWAEKRSFANLRLNSLLAETSFRSVRELIEALRKGDGELSPRVAAALTINETFFFRDARPFEQLDQVVLPRLLQSRAEQRSLRIWCAAVASGQEAYSVAMVVARHAARMRGWRVSILGTDVSREMIEKARSGRYSHFEVQRGLPIGDLIANFSKVGDSWEISPELRGMVEFRVHNLLHDMRGFGEFDVILLRNVLIYFDMKVKVNVLARVAGHLAPGGCVLLGSAESTLGLGEALAPDPVNRGIYVRPVRKPYDLTAFRS